MASDCAKREGFKISTALGKLGKLVAAGLRSVLNATLDTIKLLLQGQLAIFKPVAALETVFIDNFVIFPLSAVSATLSATQSVGKRLKELGVNNKKCSDIKAIGDSMEKTSEGKMQRFKRSLDNKIDGAKAHENFLNKVIDGMERGIGAIDVLKQ